MSLGHGAGLDSRGMAARAELLRALAVLAEPPVPEHAAVCQALGLEQPSAARYTELFVLQLYPYASVYLGEEGMLGGEARDRVAGFWRALGQTPVPEPDHLPVLLGQYAALLDAEAESDRPDREDRENWDDREDRDGAGDGRPREGLRAKIRSARQALLWEHLASWLPPFLDKLDELATPVYEDWGRLLGRALEAELATLPAGGELPLPLRANRPLPEDAESLDDLLDALLAPVRSGFLVVRSDLERCARALGVVARQAERRYALRALLGQAPADTVHWLAAEARRSADRLVAGVGPSRIRAFWIERARHTARVLEAAPATPRNSTRA